MKKSVVLASILFLAALGFVSCSEDKTTELGWTNKSGAAINDISWADGDATWNKDSGYADQSDTEMKEVNKLSGNVDAKVWQGDDFYSAPVEINNSGESSLTLNEGEADRYDIEVAKKK